MKNLKKKLAKKAGFTLVELIVVIAILAILASVAVPAYTGYIQKAQESKVYSSLDALKTAVVFTATEKATGHDAVVTKIVVSHVDGAAVVTLAVDGNNLPTGDKAVKANDGTNAGTIDALFSADNQKTLANAMQSAKVTSATWTSTGTSWELTK